MDRSINTEVDGEELPGADKMIIKSPLITEKVTGMIDSNNTMEFLVNMRATKPQIKKSGGRSVRLGCCFGQNHDYSPRREKGHGEAGWRYSRQ